LFKQPSERADIGRKWARKENAVLANQKKFSRNLLTGWCSRSSPSGGEWRCEKKAVLKGEVQKTEKRESEPRAGDGGERETDGLAADRGEKSPAKEGTL